MVTKKYPSKKTKSMTSYSSASRSSSDQDKSKRSALRPMEKKPWLARRLEQVQEVLNDVLVWTTPADVVLSRWFKQHPKLGGRDRGEIAEAVYKVLRELRLYRHIAQSGSGDAVRRLAILGLANSLQQEQKWQEVLSPEGLAWLEHARTIEPSSLNGMIQFSLPDWLYEKLNQLTDAESLMASLLLPASFDARVNPFKLDREELFTILRDMNLTNTFAATPFSPFGIRFGGHPNINKWPLFLDGKIEVQDEGSQLLSMLVAPKRGELVIDFCAGAGGKTLLLGALMRSTGRLYAFDVSEKRLANMKPRVARSGLSNVMPVLINNENDVRVKRLQGKAHRVLIDAPCSGLGTLRRNPDLKWRQKPESLDELTALQTRILDSAARCVAPNGRLVYATCSLLPEENEQQIELFLTKHPEFKLKSAADVLTGRLDVEQVTQLVQGDYLSLRPDVHATDGFFAAVLERSS